MQTQAQGLVSLPLLVLLLLGLLQVQVLAKDPCSKEWLRYMVLNSCGLDKRHADRRKPVSSVSVQHILKEVMEELDRMEAGDELMEGGADADGNDLSAAVAAPTGSSGSKVSGKNRTVLVMEDGVLREAILLDLDRADKQPSPSPSPSRGLWAKLVDHPVELLKIAEDWMGLGGNNDLLKNPRRRAVQNMISRCCSEECSADDFEGVC